MRKLWIALSLAVLASLPAVAAFADSDFWN